MISDKKHSLFIHSILYILFLSAMLPLHGQREESETTQKEVSDIEQQKPVPKEVALPKGYELIPGKVQYLDIGVGGKNPQIVAIGTDGKA